MKNMKESKSDDLGQMKEQKKREEEKDFQWL